jgi:hypothetical protein
MSLDWELLTKPHIVAPNSRQVTEPRGGYRYQKDRVVGLEGNSAVKKAR